MASEGAMMTISGDDAEADDLEMRMNLAKCCSPPSEPTILVVDFFSLFSPISLPKTSAAIDIVARKIT